MFRKGDFWSMTPGSTPASLNPKYGCSLQPLVPPPATYYSFMSSLTPVRNTPVYYSPHTTLSVTSLCPSADSNARIKERPRFTLGCFKIFKPRCDTSHIKKTATLVAHRAYCPLKMSNLRHNTINMLACAIFSQTNPVFKFT